MREPDDLEPAGRELLDDLRRFVRRNAAFVAATAILVAAAAVGISLAKSASYRATAKVQVTNVIDQPGARAQLFDATYLARLAITEASVAHTRDVAGAALQAVPGSGLSPQGLLDRARVTPEENADILHFSVTDPRAPRAVALV